MRNKLLTLASAFTLLAVLGHFYAKPLLAQARAALVKNIDEPGRTPYQQTGSCTNPFIDGLRSGSCDVVFPAITSGKRAVIEYVTADLATTSDITPSVALQENALGGGAVLVSPVFPRFSGDFGVSDRIQMYINGDEQPKFLAATGLGVNSVTISGYLVDLTQ
jgi:hypothetical protein